MFEAEVPFGKKTTDPNQPRVTAERRNWVRKETATILSKNIMVREKTKEDMFSTMKQVKYLRAKFLCKKGRKQLIISPS